MVKSASSFGSSGGMATVDDQRGIEGMFRRAAQTTHGGVGALNNETTAHRKISISWDR
jgi:hypothetical protein